MRAARRLGLSYSVIGVAGAAVTALIRRPATNSQTAFWWLLMAALLGFLAFGIVLLVLARAHVPSESDRIPAWVRPAMIAGGGLTCLGLLGTLFALAAHPALWVVVAAVASIMLGMQIFGLAAGVYRLHGGEPVG